MNDIICPHCGKIVHIDEVLRNDLEKTILRKEAEKQKIELQKVKLDAEKRIKENTEKELAKADNERKNLEQKLKEVEKSAKKNEEKIKEEVMKEASAKTRLEKLEYEKKISDMQEALEVAQRKGKQGSQQLQGEVLELDLEERLKSTFPQDEFIPVPKGVEGGDIWQKVKFQKNLVGSILWETKRTKQWSNLWLNKLKEDSARISASESIIVSESLPRDSESFDRKDGVWITTYEHAIGIARYVRFLITTVSKIKSSASQTDEDWTKIRDYMLSDSFKHRMQAHFDAVKTLREVLETEKRTSTLRWKRQQTQIDKLDTNTVNFYAELKEIVSNLPELEELETPLLKEGENNDNQETFV